MKMTILRPLMAATVLIALPVAAAPKKNIDAEADIDYRHDFQPLKEQHKTRVLIDRFHETIYKEEGLATGAHVMLNIMERDGFSAAYADAALTAASLENADILIIHGLPNQKIRPTEWRRVLEVPAWR